MGYQVNPWHASLRANARWGHARRICVPVPVGPAKTQAEFSAAVGLNEEESGGPKHVLIQTLNCGIRVQYLSAFCGLLWQQQFSHVCNNFQTSFRPQLDITGVAHFVMDCFDVLDDIPSNQP